jgi:hypothetical protein
MVKVAVVCTNDCGKEGEQEKRGNQDRRSGPFMRSWDNSAPRTFPDLPSAILCWEKLLFKVGAI